MKSKLLIISILIIGIIQNLVASDFIFSVKGNKTYLNEKEILVAGLRCSNALYSQKSTKELIKHLDEYASYGVNTAEMVRAAKPYIESEGTPKNAPGEYWGKYSKAPPLENYINIGIYTEEMKANQIESTKMHFENGWGYMCASTWLQCVDPHGPNSNPGGDGSDDNPGIRWWLEALKEIQGEYVAE